MFEYSQYLKDLFYIHLKTNQTSITNKQFFLGFNIQQNQVKQVQLYKQSQSQMSTQQLGLITQSIPYEKTSESTFQRLEKVDQEQDKLIRNDSQQTSSPPKPPLHEASQQDQIIDPIQQLTKHNDIVPLLAVLHLIDLNTLIDGTPLLSKLCTMHVPLSQHLKGREIVFKPDADNRTALHEAIAADDTAAANWCLQNGISNTRDNFGNTPILQAIKLGRKNCFLLCLHYNFYDSEVPHFCAIYNRHWELKVLHRLGYDVVSVRDSEHFTPLERAVANYSYDSAEYLTQITDRISINYLATKTDSKGIIRLISNVKKRSSTGNQIIKPLLLSILQISFIYYCITQTQFSFYQPYQNDITLGLAAILLLQTIMTAIGWNGSTAQLSRRNINILNLLKAPEFPVMQDICPQCLAYQHPNKDHCRKCGKCQESFHFHNVSCVNRKNQIFWFFLEVFWFFIIYQLHRIFVTQLKLNHLVILNFSSSHFFGNAAIIEQLYNTNLLMLVWFVFLKVFLLYQFFCLFQWAAMMVLNRTYREINNTEKYKRLYRVVKTSDGSFKSQEIRLLQRGFCLGSVRGIVNALRYFFR